jgi:hypothetical protein
VIAVVSDTHAREDPRLTGRTATAVAEAALVCHAGDFTTGTVLDAFEAASARFAGVVGNNDDRAVRERLPATRTVEHDGVRIAVAHGHEHTATALDLLGRQEGADLVVVGHSHRPGFDASGDVPVLNPGSHAQPRGNRPAHAELDLDPLRGRLVDPDGTVFETFEI